MNICAICSCKEFSVSATVSGTEIISSDSKTTYNGNYGLNAQWTLWNGNKRLQNMFIGEFGKNQILFFRTIQLQQLLQLQFIVTQGTLS